MLTKKKLREQIRKDLLLVTDYVKNSVRQDMTDINRYAEDFYCGLLNEAFGWELRNLNRERKNQPAIDLADDENHIGVQVTSTVSRDKITRTLKKFFDGGMDGKYQRLIFLVIGTEDPFQKQFTVERGFDFAPARDIWDTPRLSDMLENIDDIDTLEQVARYLGKHLDIPRREEQRPQMKLPLPGALSAEGFFGREAELAQIGERLRKDGFAVLWGLGGMGKTELAIRYARDHHRGRTYFALFRDSFENTLTQSIAPGIPALAGRGLPEEALRAGVLEHLRRCPSEDLLIIDNADKDDGTFEELKDSAYQELRKLDMQVLITTRFRAVDAIEVGQLRREELRSIFRRHGADVTRAQMDALIDAVDGHTMTVDLIARTLVESWGTVTAEQIVDAMHESTLSAGDYPGVYTDHDPEAARRQKRIYAHLSALFSLSGIGKDGRDVLGCAVLLPQEGMDGAVFYRGLPERLREELRSLEKRGWVRREKSLVRIHPVVRLVCRTELELSEALCGVFLRGVHRQYDEKQYDAVKFRQMAELFETASEVLEDRDGVWAVWAGYFWNQVAEPQRALSCNLHAVEKLEREQPDTNSLATAYNNVGGTYGNLGDHKRALEYLLKALGIREKVLPENHPDLAMSYNNVGSTYGALGDHEKALEYLLKALGIREKALPENHPDLAASYNNVGMTYGDLGDHKKALEYQLKALGILEKVLPENHPFLATSYNNVGSTCSTLGDHEKALEYLLKALGIREKVLPENHPDLAVSYNNVGMTYGDLGDHKKALEYQLKALGILEKVLPENHPSLATSYNNVGSTYSTLGEHEKALEYQLKALRIREKVLPENHPSLATSYNNVGSTYGDLGDHAKELEYLLKAFEIWEKVLPENHPHLATSCNNVAWTYYELGQAERAAGYMRRAAEIIGRSSLPEGHPDRVNFTSWAERFEREARQAPGGE